MATVFKPGEHEPLPLGLTSDSEVGDFYSALKSAVGHTVSSERKYFRGGVYKHDIFEDIRRSRRAKVISWSGNVVTALHIDFSPPTGYTGLRTKFNIYTDIGRGGLTAAQVVSAQIYNGFKVEEAYTMQDNRLYGLRTELEWEELAAALKIIEDEAK